MLHPVGQLVDLDLLPRHLGVQDGDVLMDLVLLQLQDGYLLSGQVLVLLQRVDTSQEAVHLGTHLPNFSTVVLDALVQLPAPPLLRGDARVDVLGGASPGRAHNGRQERQQKAEDQDPRELHSAFQDGAPIPVGSRRA